MKGTETKYLKWYQKVAYGAGTWHRILVMVWCPALCCCIFRIPWDLVQELLEH